MKQTKGRRQALRSPEVVWALNLLWIGLGNYYGSGFERPLWLLTGAALYAINSLHVFRQQPVDLWIVGFAVLSVVGHVNVRRHNEKVVAEQMRSRRRFTAKAAGAFTAVEPGGHSAEPLPDLLSGSAQGRDASGGSGFRRPAQICPSCGAPRDPLRFSCPQCAYFYDS